MNHRERRERRDKGVVGATHWVARFATVTVQGVWASRWLAPHRVTVLWIRASRWLAPKVFAQEEYQHV